MTRLAVERRDFLRATGAGVLLAGAGPVLLGACSTTDPGKETQGGGTLEKAKSAGSISIGFANESPYGYTDASGKLTGEAPELARVIFKALGINEVKGVQVDFGGLIAGLNAKRFDIVAAGMFITPERCQQVAFSEPEYCGLTGFLVPKGNPDDITKLEDVAAKPDFKIGVMTGAVEKGYAEGAGVRADQIEVFNDQTAAFEGLEAERVGAVCLTAISLRDVLKKHPGAPFEVTAPYAPKVDGKEQFGCGGFAFRKGDKDLLDAFNAELKKLKDGNKLLPIIQPFGFTEAELPGEHTAAELCGAG
ncbi:MAG: ectoine/hydroxyectoine ABC transporter substrate-binding protein EhuB [Streptosporangiales bacterium]|nr:ectoine/hydroxyectoine ABC transporter substrate-binding protein EhuB [Streptosporangiales bacterium]